ncbi:MAG: hypothetical protein K0T01_1247 [Acidimicrobiia bacterium]|nr:hypothetical protein [Acidimicrobiia bacterium]
MTRPRLDSCKPVCKRRGGDRTAGEDAKRGLAGPKTPILPRRTRFQDTSGYGVRRTFNPLVVGSSPTDPLVSPEMLADELDLFLEMDRAASLVPVELVDLDAALPGEIVEGGEHG